MIIGRHRLGIAAALIALNLLACWPVRSAWATADMLRESWVAYKGRFIQGDGRVVDLKAQGVSTSEGQSYALLRAVWVNDQATFDRILEWTENNLIQNARRDTLYAWRWGKRDDNSWGVLDSATASDADEDAAFALLLANSVWRNQKYASRASRMLADMWDKETVVVAGQRYLLAGDAARTAVAARINPSYFAPYAYRFFARNDPAHDWQSLINAGYSMLEQAANASRVGLPPNWAQLDLQTGAVTVADSLTSHDADYSYDAIRVFWRIALDYRLNHAPEALNFLKHHTDWLRRYWLIRKQAPAEITADGIVRSDYEALEQYAALIPGLELVAPDVAQDIYQAKLSNAYQDGFWARPNTDDPYKYYAQNIVWFGLAVYRDTLPLNGYK